MQVILYEKEFSRGFSWDEHIGSAKANSIEEIPKVINEILEKHGHPTGKLPGGFYIEVRN